MPLALDYSLNGKPETNALAGLYAACRSSSAMSNSCCISLMTPSSGGREKSRSADQVDLVLFQDQTSADVDWKAKGHTYEVDWVPITAMNQPNILVQRLR